jgi:hypothetical protein
MHFFTELSIPSQNSTSSLPYGPHTGGFGLELTSYITYSAFAPSSDLKVFACQNGMMFIQESDFPDTINVIIKPSDSLSIPFSGVKYYIYRGLRKDSFIDSSGPEDIITLQDSSNSEFMARFWTNHENLKLNESNPLLPNPTPDNLGLDALIAGTVNVEDLFNNSQEARQVKVLEGEWIGTFNSAVPVSFEIIVDSELLTVDLNYLRATSSSVSAMSNPVLSEDITEDNAIRERIHSYIDPAAFFGMHFDDGIKTSSYSGTVKTTVVMKKQDLYDNVLSLFLTKNRVYIDIKSERGYSYNYYGIYGDTNDNLIRILDHSTSTLNDHIYYTNKWPIYYTDVPQGNENVGKTKIQLRVDDNVKPLLFFRDKGLIRKIIRPHFLEEKKLLDGTNTDWTKEIKLRFSNADEGGNKVNVAQVLQMQYFIQDFSLLSASDVIIPFDLNDDLFANASLETVNSNKNIFQHVKANKLTLVQGEDYAYLGRAGAYVDTNTIVFYVQPEYSIRQSKNKYPKPSKVTKSKITEPTDSPVFPSEIKLSRTKIADGMTDIFVMSISNIQRHRKPAKKEEFFMLCMTKTEYNSLIALANAEGFTANHNWGFVFSDETIEDWNDPVPYTKYELNISGYNDIGWAESTELTGSGIYIYTQDQHAFNTTNYGDLSDVPEALVDPGTLAPWKTIVKWQYDKDDSSVQLVQPTGYNTSKDPSNNNSAVVTPILKIDTEIRGICYYPHYLENGPVSSMPGSRPAVVICHGNGQDYLEYEEVCKHLARNGFITTSLSCLFSYDVFKVGTFSGTQATDMAPWTHWFKTDDLYFYNNTSTDVDYQKVSVYTGTDEDLSNNILNAGLTRVMTKWKKKGQGVFDLNAGLDEITFSKDTGYLHGMAQARTELIYEHMRVLRKKFGTKMDNKFLLFGHSRGAERVIPAANQILDNITPSAINTEFSASGVDLDGVKGVLSLAPTSQYSETDQNLWTKNVEKLTQPIPYLLIYGSRDYDTSGAYPARIEVFNKSPRYLKGVLSAGNSDLLTMGSGFSIYDRSSDQEKSTVFVHGATHNGFITTSQRDINEAKRYGWAVNPSTDIEDDEVQKSVILAYANAFARRCLYDQDYWLPYFKAELQPESVQSDKIQQLYEPNHSLQLLVAYPSDPSRTPASIAGLTETYNGTSSKKQSGDLRFLDGQNVSTVTINGTSPSHTKGVLLEWESGKSLTFGFPTQSVSAYSHVSLRIANATRGVVLKGVEVGLTDASQSHFLQVRDIIFPDVRTDKTVKYREIDNINDTTESYSRIENQDPTKYAIETLRFKLSDYIDKGLDPATVKEIIVKFPSSGSGKVTIDNILFTND